MNEQEKIDLIKFMFEQWKKAERELLVFKTALSVFRDESPQIQPALDKLVAAGRNSPEVDKHLDGQFSGFDELIESIGEGSLEKVVREFQEKFGSKSQIH